MSVIAVNKIKISNLQTNKSKSKQMFSFTKEKRFRKSV